MLAWFSRGSAKFLAYVYGPWSRSRSSVLRRSLAASCEGEAAGDGPPLVLLHGLSATRRNVVQGSRHLLSAATA